MKREDLGNANIHIFNEIYAIKNEQGLVLDFSDHAFLWDIYSDLSPHQAIRKAAQVGFSTTAIIKSLWLAKQKKMDMIYTLPTYGDVHEFVTGKVNRIIQQNPIFKDWTSDKDTILQKKVGESVIYYRGTWSERDALMISSDLNVHDEVDRSNLKVVDQYYSRLQHSKYAWQWLFSNPSVPDQGVDKLWNRSDQKHWFIKCEHCNHHQYLTMSNIVNEQFVCSKCFKPIDRTSGEWVKRWRDIEISGYWISLLMCPWVSAKTIKELERTKSPEFFANFVLGVPYIGSGNAVTKDMIMRNLTDEVNRQDGRIVIGVDTGIDTRYVVGNRQGLFYYGQCTGYDEIRALLKRWDKAIVVIDQGGDIVEPRKLREEFRNRVFLATYIGDRQGDQLVKWNDAECTVTIERSRTIQLVIDEFNDKRIPIFGNETDWYDYWLHWSHIYRTAEENSHGALIHKWQRSDRDDWVQATVYWRAGMDRFSETSGAIIDISSSVGETGYTATPDGKHMFSPLRKLLTD